MKLLVEKADPKSVPTTNNLLRGQIGVVHGEIRDSYYLRSESDVYSLWVNDAGELFLHKTPSPMILDEVLPEGSTLSLTTTT